MPTKTRTIPSRLNGHGTLSREALLALDDRPVVTLDVPGWGSVHVRKLSLQDFFAVSEFSGVERSLEMARRSLVDVDGAPLFPKEEAAVFRDWIDNRSAEPVMALFNMLYVLNEPPAKDDGAGK